MELKIRIYFFHFTSRQNKTDRKAYRQWKDEEKEKTFKLHHGENVKSGRKRDHGTSAITAWHQADPDMANPKPLPSNTSSS